MTIKYINITHTHMHIKKVIKLSNRVGDYGFNKPRLCLVF